MILRNLTIYPTQLCLCFVGVCVSVYIGLFELPVCLEPAGAPGDTQYLWALKGGFMCTGGGSGEEEATPKGQICLGWPSPWGSVLPG